MTIKPNSIFLKAKLSVYKNELIISYSIDSSAFYTKQDSDRCNLHIQHMDLGNRLLKSSIDFMHSELMSLSTDVHVLLNVLPERIKEK